MSAIDNLRCEIGNARRREIGRVRGFDFCVFASLHDILFQLAGRPRLRLDSPYRLGPPRHRNQEKSVIVRRLEESAEGCRWLLARTGELLNIINCVAAWGDAEIVRLVGLLGKRGIAQSPSHPPTRTRRWYSSARPSSGRSGGCRSCWPSMRTSRPTRRPSGTTARRSIAAGVSSGTRGTSRRGRGSCCGTLEDFRKRRKDEFGTGGMADGKCQMVESGDQMAKGKWQKAEGGDQMANGGCQMADRQKPDGESRTPDGR